MTLLSLEQLEAIVGLLIGLNSILCVSRKKEVCGEGERWMDGQGVEQSEVIYLSIKFTALHRHSLQCPKTITMVTSEITDYRLP